MQPCLDALIFYLERNFNSRGIVHMGFMQKWQQNNMESIFAMALKTAMVLSGKNSRLKTAPHK